MLQDVENVGKKYEVKDVKDGHARNLLIPKGLAKAATASSLKWAAAQMETEAKRAEEELKGAQELASRMDGAEILIPVKTGEKDQLFEKITVSRVAEKLKAAGFAVKKSQIDMTEPIREIGEFPIKIKFAHNLEAEVKIIVSEEK